MSRSTSGRWRGLGVGSGNGHYSLKVNPNTDDRASQAEGQQQSGAKGPERRGGGARMPAFYEELMKI